MTKDQEDAIRLAKDACDHALSMCGHDHTNEEAACWHLINKAYTQLTQAVRFVGGYIDVETLREAGWLS